MTVAFATGAFEPARRADAGALCHDWLGVCNPGWVVALTSGDEVLCRSLVCGWTTHVALYLDDSLPLATTTPCFMIIARASGRVNAPNDRSFYVNIRQSPRPAWLDLENLALVHRSLPTEMMGHSGSGAEKSPVKASAAARQPP